MWNQETNEEERMYGLSMAQTETALGQIPSVDNPVSSGLLQQGSNFLVISPCDRSMRHILTIQPPGKDKILVTSETVKPPLKGNSQGALGQSLGWNASNGESLLAPPMALSPTTGFCWPLLDIYWPHSRHPEAARLMPRAGISEHRRILHKHNVSKALHASLPQYIQLSGCAYCYPRG